MTERELFREMYEDCYVLEVSRYKDEYGNPAIEFYCSDGFVDAYFDKTNICWKYGRANGPT